MKGVKVSDFGRDVSEVVVWVMHITRGRRFKVLDLTYELRFSNGHNIPLTTVEGCLDTTPTPVTRASGHDPGTPYWSLGRYCSTRCQHFNADGQPGSLP